jgi:hypothetical protein
VPGLRLIGRRHSGRIVFGARKDVDGQRPVVRAVSR